MELGRATELLNLLQEVAERAALPPRLLWGGHVLLAWSSCEEELIQLKGADTKQTCNMVLVEQIARAWSALRKGPLLC